MNPQIQPALEEVAAVLRKHNMAGIVMVANATHCDYQMEISPSWSCAKFETDGKGNVSVRILSKLANYPNKEAQKAALEATIGMFVTFNDVMARLTEQNNKLLVMLGREVQFVGRSTLEQ